MTGTADGVARSHRERFEADGYFVCGPVFNPGQVAELIERVERLVADHRSAAMELSTTPGASYRLLAGGTARDARYRELLLTNPGLLDVVESLIGPVFRLLEDQIFYKPGFGGAVANHQDNVYYGIEQSRVVTCWVALDDTTPENGCLRILPGSHAGPVPHRKVGNTYIREALVDERLLIPVPVAAGHMVVLHNLVVHGSGPNKTPRPRRGVNVVCMPDGTRAALRVFSGAANPYLRGGSRGAAGVR
jgi:hypothetical protein